jgi:hypothetical protein
MNEMKLLVAYRTLTFVFLLTTSFGFGICVFVEVHLKFRVFMLVRFKKILDFGNIIIYRMYKCWGSRT